jgi:hypothetical protein
VVGNEAADRSPSCTSAAVIIAAISKHDKSTDKGF